MRLAQLITELLADTIVVVDVAAAVIAFSSFVLILKAIDFSDAPSAKVHQQCIDVDVTPETLLLRQTILYSCLVCFSLASSEYANRDPLVIVRAYRARITRVHPRTRERTYVQLHLQAQRRDGDRNAHLCRARTARKRSLPVIFVRRRRRKKNRRWFVRMLRASGTVNIYYYYSPAFMIPINYRAARR